MNCIRLGLLGLFSLLVCLDAAFGGTFSVLVDTDSAVGVNDSRFDPSGKGAVNSDTKPGSNGPVDAESSIVLSFHDIVADIDTTAHATPGDVGVKFIGTMTRGIFGSAEFSSTASAEWRDTGSLSSNFGPSLVVHALLKIADPFSPGSGGFGFETSAAPFSGAGVGPLELETLSQFTELPPAPYGGKIWASIQASPNSQIFINNEAPQSIPIRMVVVPGLDFPMGFRVTLNEHARSGIGTTFFRGDFGGSLHWGGIQSVTDLAGNPIPDDQWTFTSASGFDYTKPFAVPEPSSFLLTAIGGLALLAFRRRHA